MEIRIDAPPVLYRAGGRPSQSYYRDAARKLRDGYEVGGSNVRAAIAAMLDNAAAAMDDAMGAGATEPDAWPPQVMPVAGADTLEPYEREMLDQIKGMRWYGPVTASKIQRRLHVGFAKAAKLLHHLHVESADMS